jgi:hypothetical protein
LKYRKEQAGCETVSWTSAANAAYLILVSGADEFSDGSVELTITNNDKCENAFGPVTAKGGTYYGSFHDDVATVDEDVPACGGASEPVRPGVWYKVAGTGGLIKADTCTATVVDTQISVFKGSCSDTTPATPNEAHSLMPSLFPSQTPVTSLASATPTEAHSLMPSLLPSQTPVTSLAPATPTEAHSLTPSLFSSQTPMTSLVCVAGDQNSCGKQSSVAWNSESGVIYYILVHSQEGSSGTSSGDFFLKVEAEASALQPNDICQNAQALEVDIGQEINVTVPLRLSSEGKALVV